MRIDVALERKDGYFTMIKETDVAVSHDEKPAPAKPSPSTIEASAKPVCEPAA